MSDTELYKKRICERGVGEPCSIGLNLLDIKIAHTTNNRVKYESLLTDGEEHICVEEWGYSVLSNHEPGTCLLLTNFNILKDAKEKTYLIDYNRKGVMLKGHRASKVTEISYTIRKLPYLTVSQLPKSASKCKKLINLLAIINKIDFITLRGNYICNILLLII